MGTATQLTDFQDLYTDLQNRAREQTGITATQNQAKRYINIALHDMHIGQGEKFPWAEREAMLITKAKYTTGTVAIVNGDATLTGTSTLWNTANTFNVKNVIVGGKFVIDGGEGVYEVTTVTSDTSVVVWPRFVQGTVSGASYVYFEDEYDLATDFLRPIDKQRFNSQGSIDLVGRTEFRRRYPANRIPGKPVIATMSYGLFEGYESATATSLKSHPTLAGHLLISAVTGATEEGDLITLSGTTNYDGDYRVAAATGFFITVKGQIDGAFTAGTLTRRQHRKRSVRFHPPPDSSEMIRYQYVTSDLSMSRSGSPAQSLTRDTDEPVVPLQYRHAIVFHALSHWYRDKQDDVRSQEAANEYTNIMMRILADSEIGGARPQFRPRVGTYRARAKRPWRGGSSRYDINGEFDRLER